MAVICCLLLTVIGCAPQPDVTATDRDNGGHIQLQHGELFDVVLADDYDETGCQWRDEQGYDDDVLHQLGSRYQPGRKPPSGDGNGTATERYRAQETGTVRLELVESDNSGKVCRRYAVQVSVGPRTIASSIEDVLGFVVTVVGAGLAFGLIVWCAYKLAKRARRRSVKPPTEP